MFVVSVGYDASHMFIYALPAFQEWLAEAVKEPWVVDQDEIDIVNAKRDAAGNA